MQSASITIPTPCAQSWADMTPQGAGRHCASCQKVVIDFTQKTDAEILAILRAAAGGGTCGRFQENQLARPLRQPVSVRSGGWSTAVAATVALLLGRTALAPDAQAQAPASQHPAGGRQSPEPDLLRVKESRPAESVKGEISEVAVPDSIFRKQVSGQVVDNIGTPLPGVTVLLQGTTHGVSTDFQGRFLLVVDASEQQYPISFSSIGYSSIICPQPITSQPLRIVLKESSTAMTGVIVVGGAQGYYPPIYTPRGLWLRVSSIPYRVSNLFR